MPRLTALAPLSLSLLLAACGEGEPLLPADAVLPDGTRYYGSLVDGRLQGEGRLDYPDGSTYRGNFVAGRFAGEGRLERQGEIYQGQFKDGLFDGLGLYLYADGSQYQGQFSAGQASGQGMRTDAQGNQFSGLFVAGVLQGPGSYRGAEGDLYSGGFEADQFHGQGRYQSTDGSVWSGQFKNGSLSGEGQYLGTDGSSYQGQFRDWLYHGKGQLSQADGSIYIGQFVRDEFHGQGVLTHADGQAEAGTWATGRRIRDDAERLLPDPLEIALLDQGRLLDEALAAVPTSSPAPELYTLTLAGDGKQSVFLREADYVTNLLTERFAAHGSVTLVNHRDHLADRPLATRENLARAIQTLAERSGPEDVVFLYLTSHGSASHALNLDQPRLQLADLAARDLATLLQPLADRHKVVVISACYSGGFIPPLKDDKTLIMTAARSDRVSFGCSEEADFTYFGRALFADALSQTDDLQKAFDLAAAHVAEREQADGFEASQPQLWAPPAVLNQWRRVRDAQSASHD
ncbi:MAG: caspase family protein [Gammaproteobacteria bacterium]|nr:caspase family protein [Gammaproteobacteria bacterium]MBU1491248.1 caspase family protein [Gammaproteobacteria bacterium]MBU2140770.1 caspase family protein [Gammaproteobacteria bacterium]MBU2216746.1 caspase family protein [Gammaproteobacteria bacterium]MBU2324458.1 caspase family protein [Gammaproteobacteria bacterium]